MRPQKPEVLESHTQGFFAANDIYVRQVADFWLQGTGANSGDKPNRQVCDLWIGDLSNCGSEFPFSRWGEHMI